MSASRKCPEHSALDTTDCHGSVRSMRVDTGADCTLGHVDLEPHLKDSRKSDVVIEVAKNGVTMATAMEGTFQAYAINNSNYDGIDYSTPVDISLITVPDLSEELLAVCLRISIRTGGVTCTSDNQKMDGAAWKKAIIKSLLDMTTRTVVSIWTMSLVHIILPQPTLTPRMWGKSVSACETVPC